MIFDKFLPVGLVLMGLVWLKFPAIRPPGESSVWCDYDLTGNKMCKFRDLVYDNGSFLFHLTNNSVISGLRNYKDFQTVQLSSVKNHNRFFANLSQGVLNCDRLAKVVVIARFKPDNLMHVIHDDLLPLFVTLEKICNADLDSCFMNLLFIDDLPSSYNFLYALFGNIVKPEHCTVFEEAHLGLNLQTVWYQYGFGRSRGAVEPILVKTDTLRRFKKFMLTKLEIREQNVAKKVVILNRLSNRRIINIEKITEFVKQLDVRFQISVLDVEPHGLESLIRNVVNTDVLIGMHGAEMILALFLPNNAKVIELFPFGISPSAVSFLKPLSDSNLAHFSYTVWENRDMAGTVRHPEYSAYLGGVGHLEESERNFLKGLKKIDSVVCCNDPGFLHLMYQDTVIGEDFQPVLSRAFEQGNFFLESDWRYPDRPHGLVCFVSNNFLVVNWSSGRNAGNAVVYSVLLEIDGKAFEVQTSEESLSSEFQGTRASVWVAATLVTNNHTSRDVFASCN